MNFEHKPIIEHYRVGDLTNPGEINMIQAFIEQLNENVELIENRRHTTSVERFHFQALTSLVPRQTTKYWISDGDFLNDDDVCHQALHVNDHIITVHDTRFQGDRDLFVISDHAYRTVFKFNADADDLKTKLKAQLRAMSIQTIQVSIVIDHEAITKLTDPIKLTLPLKVNDVERLSQFLQPLLLDQLNLSAIIRTTDTVRYFLERQLKAKTNGTFAAVQTLIDELESLGLRPAKTFKRNQLKH